MAAPLRSDRRTAVFHDEDKLRCPEGHPIKKLFWAPTLTAVRCTWRSDGPRSPECGSIVLLFAVSDGLRYVVEVTHVEAQHVESNRMTPAEAARFLGLSWTPDPDAHRLGGAR